MSTKQTFNVTPPTSEDSSLEDFSEIVQRNVSNLFDLSHTHDVRTVVPTLSDLEIGTPVTVLTEGIYYIYVKVSTTQLARVALTLV